MEYNYMREVSVLKHLYSNLHTNSNYTPIKMYHSDVHYVKAAFTVDNWELQPDKYPDDITREAFNEITLEELHQIMLEEGLLPYYEYNIPRWYARKYFSECKRRKK